MAALSRPAGPAYSLLRARPGGNEVVGITHQYGPGAEADHRFFIQAFCRLVAGMYSGRRDRFVFVFVTFRRVVELSPLLRPSPVID